jgi:hypothetical protein
MMLVAVMVAAAAGEARAEIPPTWCTHATAQRLVGDVNNDPYDDLVCHDRSSGAKWVALGRSGGGHDEVWSSPSGWCSHANAALLLGDVNGDGRADLVCRDPSRVWIDYASPAFFEGTDWTLDTAWCTHSGTTLSLADQNADGRADLVCRGGEHTWIDYADAAGHFLTTDAGRATIDLEITNIIRGASTYQINLLNTGGAGVVTSVDCTVGPYAVSRPLSLSIAAGASAVTFLSGLPFVTAATVRCTAHGRGADGLPELLVSNNSMSKYF